MKIAILSDLHIGPGAKTRDMCPVERLDGANFSPASVRAKEFSEEFVDFVKSRKLTADYLMVPGDVTDGAHPTEVRMASAFLMDVAKAFAVPENRILFVPGNHDVDWSLFDPHDTTGIKWSHRYMALNSDQFLFSRVNKNARRGTLFSDAYYTLWEFDDLLVLGYNSSATDCAEDKGRCGNIEQDHIDKLKTCLQALKIENNRRLKIFMIHHHLRGFKLPFSSDRDFTQANNPESLITVLQDNKFDFIVNGHRHYSFFDAVNSKIPMLCAGSFSAKLMTDWEGYVLNQFHVIDIEKTRRWPLSSRGIVRSWSHTMKGWQASPGLEVFGGEPHERAFGASLEDKKLADRIRRCLQKLCTERRDFSWRSDVAAMVSDVCFLCEAKDKIVKWCKETVFAERRGDVFIEENGDIHFVSKGGV